MKFTNKGKNIKDNSRRTGAGAERAVTRRKGALQRFRIMPQTEWATNRFNADGGSQNCGRENYDGYVARRSVELEALKRSLNVA